ncbi:peptidylprolyl isomerase [Chryseolinea lacunae]|uniref:peptidylprolyl isomerase n=1 Tax=Chryseolinea lacunae TaxID=2801331 RepID=A0ABS1KQG3_9BACT|nr:peptidylprolyl isomerase [Chryseolinea lacunae]MBL0741705.1 peptidylprolyl isomerase [Chryseolinea lacunae]
MKHGVYSLAVLLSLFCILSSCQKNGSPQGANKFSDTVFVAIAQFQDVRDAGGLYAFLDDKNPEYRKAAVLAFASIQDSLSVARLENVLMSDPASDVRKAAAFSLGQTSSLQSRTVLANAFASEKVIGVQNEILEAYGKVTKTWSLSTTPVPEALNIGLAWSFYRAGLNGATDSLVNHDAARLLGKQFSDSVRMAAAHYFSRGAKNFQSLQDSLIRSASHGDAEVRMAATLALRKLKSDAARVAVQNILKHDDDYRVRANAARALQSFSFDSTKRYLLDALTDKNVNVGIAASEAIKSALTPNHSKEILAHARITKPWRIQANLYDAVLALGSDDVVEKEILTLCNTTSNPYQKAALLSALQYCVKCYGFVAAQMFDDSIPVVRSAAAAALVAMNYQKGFTPALAKTFGDIYVRGIQTNDPGIVGTVAQALGDSTLGYKKILRDTSFLYTAKKKLSLPRDIETLQPLEAVIAYFEGRKNVEPLKNTFNHPIDWALVKRIPRDQKAIIKTSKGDVTVRFFVEETPGSVANFIALVQQAYFNHKFFHRVVPNFVVQGGCNRGDGLGNEGYSIRSEFSERRYTTGSLGMASAGKDTEGTQWFITHSPTPHLDGRYTIFAEVEQGMDVVHGIEVGDEIVDVVLVPALKP